MDTPMITPAEFLSMFDEDKEPPEEATLVKEGEWENDYKDYSTKEAVFRMGDRFFCVVSNRSGSYYSDYEYGDLECFEVTPVEVTRTEYVVKK